MTCALCGARLVPGQGDVGVTVGSHGLKVCRQCVAEAGKLAPKQHEMVNPKSLGVVKKDGDLLLIQGGKVVAPLGDIPTGCGSTNAPILLQDEVLHCVWPRAE